ncbi:hypothetical protein Acr_08g0001020 [Actinidia rufa]|uniref:C2H2-type domain-containing protein n=1 Tax=Actinidia rufa TaxID=165716 RepID=A0A7J0EZS3_9ERIC|nr:hypothetical protein Acr_08g0001020 [Actinidia rufa]
MELVIRKQIIKGKRTKRKRSRSSPIPISISMANCSSSGEGGGGYGDNDVNTATATTTTPWYLETTDEDVDAGDSLILLSLGQPRDPNGDDQEKVASKFTSEQCLDRQTIGGGGGGEVGVVVYRCKTCDRTFSSFRSLGGHTTSHTRPKPQMASCDNPKASSKVHECPICVGWVLVRAGLGRPYDAPPRLCRNQQPKIVFGLEWVRVPGSRSEKGENCVTVGSGFGS